MLKYGTKIQNISIVSMTDGTNDARDSDTLNSSWTNDSAGYFNRINNSSRLLLRINRHDIQKAKCL